MEIVTGIIVALITACGTIANTIITKHYSKKDDIKKLEDLIKEMKADSDTRDDALDRKFKGIAMMYAKTYLIDFMSRIEKGEEMNVEQIRLLYELKETYNKAGGDSYVDDMFEKLKKAKII